MQTLSIYDSTLRDGAQGMGISYSLEDKLAVIALLDRLGVEYIEAGNPYSNPKDMELYRRALYIKLRKSKLVAFGSTRRKDCTAAEDGNLQALVQAGTQVCTIFGKSWGFHVENVIETSLGENLLMIEQSCRFLKDNGKELIFDAEHFFDGYRDDPAYALECLKAAGRGGADMLCLCDTNGGAFPEEVKKAVEAACKISKCPVSVHFHDDCGMAVANSIISVKAGARQVQGTLLGTGERCGNANLLTVIGDLQVKRGIGCIPQENLKKLTAFAKELAAIDNRDMPKCLPFVGEYAFAHKAGMHAAAVLKTSRSFEHVDPLLVGNRRSFPTSEMSGKTIILERIRALLPKGEDTEDQAQWLLEHIKGMEQEGYQFEGADASFQLLVQKQIGIGGNYFHLINYRIYTGFGEEEGCSASATVKIKVGDTVQLMAAEGNGPVNALDKALRKALEVFYPQLSQVKLTDYKVRVLDSCDATAAKVRVLITSWDGKSYFTTVGVSEDVVDASWKALKDSMEYVLLQSSIE